MSDAITIISKEPITGVPFWLASIGVIISILIVCSTFIYWYKVKNCNKVIKYICIVAPIALIICFTYMCITCIFFSQPTGRYRYEGIIDKSKITLEEFETFKSTYHPTHDGNIYYWEDPIS
jgi:hypothetical protein